MTLLGVWTFVLYGLAGAGAFWWLRGARRWVLTRFTDKRWRKGFWARD